MGGVGAAVGGVADDERTENDVEDYSESVEEKAHMHEDARRPRKATAPNPHEEPSSDTHSPPSILKEHPVRTSSFLFVILLRSWKGYN